MQSCGMRLTCLLRPCDHMIKRIVRWMWSTPSCPWCSDEMYTATSSVAHSFSSLVVLVCVQPYRQPLLVEPDRYRAFQRLKAINERARDVREVFPHRRAERKGAGTGAEARGDGEGGDAPQLTSPAEIIDEPMDEDEVDRTKTTPPVTGACCSAEGVRHRSS